MLFEIKVLKVRGKASYEHMRSRYNNDYREIVANDTEKTKVTDNGCSTRADVKEVIHSIENDEIRVCDENRDRENGNATFLHFGGGVRACLIRQGGNNYKRNQTWR